MDAVVIGFLHALEIMGAMFLVAIAKHIVIRVDVDIAPDVKPP